MDLKRKETSCELLKLSCVLPTCALSLACCTCSVQTFTVSLITVVAPRLISGSRPTLKRSITEEHLTNAIRNSSRIGCWKYPHLTERIVAPVDQTLRQQDNTVLDFLDKRTGW